MSVTEATSQISHNTFKSPPGAGLDKMGEVLRGGQVSYDVRSTNSIIDPNEIGLEGVLASGEYTKVIEIINLGDTQDVRLAAVVAMYDGTTDRYRTALGGMTIDATGDMMLNNQWEPLDKTRPITLGRRGDSDDGSGVVGSEVLWPGAGYFPGSISREHVTISLEGETVIIEDTSTNGTKLYGRKDEEGSYDDFGHISQHTISAKQAARIAGLLRQDSANEHEMYAGRPVISRTTTDPEGMVDLRSWVGGGEAIVVDSSPDKGEENAAAYQELLQGCLGRLARKKVFSERDIIQAIYETVDSTMEYDLDFVSGVYGGLDGGGGGHRKVNLAVYMGLGADKGRGVCRHMALASQWLGARMVEKYPELLGGGSFTAPVNQREKDNSAHEWVRYTNKDGKVYIIDVAQHFVGTLDEVIQDSANGKRRWEYFANGEEKRQYEQKYIGGIVVKRSLSERLQQLRRKK